MEEYIKETEEKIEELKSWRDSLEREATHEKWVRRVGYFVAGWNFYKLIAKKSTLLSNIAMGVGFFVGHNAGSNIDALGHNYSIASRMVEEKEEELKKLQKLEKEQKEESEKAKQLVLEKKDEQ